MLVGPAFPYTDRDSRRVTTICGYPTLAQMGRLARGRGALVARSVTRAGIRAVILERITGEETASTDEETADADFLGRTTLIQKWSDDEIVSDMRHYLKMFKTLRLDVPSGPSREALDKADRMRFPSRPPRHGSATI